MLELEKHLENPMDPERVRFLEGNDLKPAQLHTKLEEVRFFFLLNKMIIVELKNKDA